MIYPYFITYMAAGLILAGGVFAWALKNGQFKDQQRARYLPLEESAKAGPPSDLSRIRKTELGVLAGLAVAGLGASGAAIVFSLLQNRP